ncbi:hypothetical protein G8T60_12025 [Clostridium botulinum C]|uniref:Sigma-70 family RNA polymerase sigma factor n=1 Tax=Clostridium haemolyticum NCTC 9693 TaxID=1443114 RepID=A0ABR4TGS9_CLOHA|nr:hypothetical protein Z960_03560 [Clostridium haemolyticum NCTC 9693]KGN02934.1 hypothetical protein Z961_07820 [Clostridium haemolyticum NCTC 8350]MCD3206791.1 hypothetical protein [Clostridium botulinum C]MCD3209554.1 hypothetical protein [Clostridium botulinum C]MCD3226591.1 hypothetical protein [Clostridium botulinum C]
MDKDIFRKTEKKLYNYFGKDRKIESLKRKIILLKNQIVEIERKIKNVDIDIPEESRAITYEEKVQTSSDYSSYAERTLIRINDRLIKEKARKEEEISELEEEIRSIEADNIIIELNVKDLCEEDKSFLKLKYGESKKDWQVGEELGMAQSTATRQRQRLVEDVARWEELLKNVH